MAVPIATPPGYVEPTFIPYPIPWTPPLAPGADLATTFTVNPGSSMASPDITMPFASPLAGMVGTVSVPGTGKRGASLSPQTGPGEPWESSQIVGARPIPSAMPGIGGGSFGSLNAGQFIGSGVVSTAAIGVGMNPVILLRLWAMLRSRAMSGLGGSALGGAALGPFGAVMGAGGGLLSRGWVRNVLGAVGVASMADLVLSVFGIDLFSSGGDDDDVIDMIEDIESMVASGAISIAGPRRGDDSGATPSIFVLDLAGRLNRGNPFITWEYFSRNFVNAVRAKEEKRGFRKTVRRKR